MHEKRDAYLLCRGLMSSLNRPAGNVTERQPTA